MTKTDFFKILKISLYTLSVFLLMWLFIIPLPLDRLKVFKVIYSRIEAITVFITFFWTVYFLWLWKFTFFQYLIIKKPSLSGTWIGYLRSDFNSQIDPVKIVFVIHQSFFSIRISSFTQGFVAHSFGETLHYDHESKKITLTYLFAQNAVLPGEIDKRQGSGELFFYEEYLAGYYWTIAKTYGFIRVHKVSKKGIHSFENAEEKYGDCEIVLKCYELIANKPLDYKL